MDFLGVFVAVFWQCRNNSYDCGVFDRILLFCKVLDASAIVLARDVVLFR